MSDPDARPIRKRKLGKPNEFGSVAPIAVVTPSTKRARADLAVRCSLPAARAACANRVGPAAAPRVSQPRRHAAVGRSRL